MLGTVGRDSSVGIATELRGSKPGGGEIFRTRPDQPWGSNILLYNGYRAGRGVDHPLPSNAEVKGRDAEIHVCVLGLSVHNLIYMRSFWY